MDNEYQKNNLANCLENLTGSQQGSSSSKGIQMDFLDLERAGTSTALISKGSKTVFIEGEDDIEPQSMTEKFFISVILSPEIKKIVIWCD